MYLKEIINTKDKNKAFNYIINLDYSFFKYKDIYNRLLDEEFLNIKEEDISSTGYVVDTLEAVIYSINKGNNYFESIFTAVNLGGDTDTIGALTGSIAGIIYGIEDIPSNLLDDLVKKDYVIEYGNMFNNFLRSNNKKQKKKILLK